MGVLIATRPEEISLLRTSVGMPAFDPADFIQHGADAHLCALSPSGHVCARCSIWWKETPPFQHHQVGCVGHYSSVDDAAASELITRAIQILQNRGCTIAFGPMDGNTWRRYRFVTERSSEPAFFLEPTNPPEWPLQFERAGFVPLAQYFSALNSNLSLRDDRIPRVAQRMNEAGVRISSATSGNLRSRLVPIYRLSQQSFAHNFLYTELPESAFVAQYEQVLPYVRPELVLLAERDDELVGYLFAIPDMAQAARREIVDTFIIKTVAILPDVSLQGLGALLVARAQELGCQLGFRRCIHALMFESNVSRNISRHYATTMRRYTLYCRELRP